MDDGFAPAREQDPASMVAELGQRLDRETLARAIGVKPSELDMIGAGYAPKPETAERLRLLHRLAATTDDLRDPKALLAGLGLTDDSKGSLPLALLPRVKTYLIAFLLFDTVVFIAVMVALLVLR